MILDIEKMAQAEKPVEIQIVQSSTELIQNVYNLIERAFSSNRGKRPQVIVGLSGGSLVKTLADVLPSLREDYLSTARFIFCDERKVPLDNADSTYGEFVKLVYPRLRPMVSQDQFIQIEPTLPVNECAVDYEKKLRTLVGESEAWPEIDVALLGIGPDGHTCSLFPGHPAVQEQHRWVVGVNDSPKPPPERVTLTMPVLNHARRIVFVVTGAAKADVVKEILEGTEAEKSKYPPGLISPSGCGRIYWILDQEAASKLTKPTKPSS